MTLLSKAVAAIILVLQFSSCGIYGFKGITIPSNVNTYLVEDFTLRDPNTPADLDQLIAESLRRTIRNESKLVRDEFNPDISFSGYVADYDITFIAPSEGSTASLNRLEIKIKVIYEDFKNEDNSWEESFRAFEDFDSNADFESLVDGLTDNILTDIIERIYNKAFTNW